MAYRPYYLGFFSNALHGKDYVPKTMYINKYCWKIALISLLFSLDRDVQQFVNNVLHIDVANVTIQFTYNDIANPQPHDAYNWLEGLKRQYGTNDIPLEELRDFGLGNTLHKEMTEDKLIFFYLYFLHIPKKTPNQPIDKLISTISIKLGSIEFDSFSEGQKKMILIACITQILGDENSLVLLDEPDAHVHIENKKKILETITQYNGQTILTTHSPIFIDMMNQEDIRYVESGSIVNMDRIKTITKISEGRISILEGALVATAKKMIITEGPDDVKHIKAAISELSKRHLDYAKLSRIPITFQGGAKLVNEYYESIIKPVYNNLEKIIFVFDYDSEGREGAKLVEKLQLEKITYVYYYDNYPIAQNAHDFFLEDFYPRTIYPDIQLPQIQKEPTFYEMKKCSTLTNSVKSRLQKMIKDGELKGTNFDGYVNFLNQLVAIFNPLL
jgi:ABC-type multidrug transport system ATPase subunit